MNERKRKKNTKTEDFKIGFDDSILKMIGTNDREDNKLKIALITCEFNGPTQNGGIGTQFTALAKYTPKPVTKSRYCSPKAKECEAMNEGGNSKIG